MTHTRSMADSEGAFGHWKDHPERCKQMVEVGTAEPVISASHLRDEGRVFMVCGKPMQYRVWESSCGGWEDYQYRCEAGHTWWVDGIDS